MHRRFRSKRPLLSALLSAVALVTPIFSSIAQNGHSPEGGGNGGGGPDDPPPSDKCAVYQFESYSTTSVVFEGGDASKVVKFHPERGDEVFVDDLINWFQGFVDICNFMKSLKDLGTTQGCGSCGHLVNQCSTELNGVKDYFGTPLDLSGMCWTVIADPRPHKGWQACVKYGIGEALAGGGASPGYVPAGIQSGGSQANYWNWETATATLPDWLKEALRETDFGGSTFPLDASFTRFIFYIEPVTNPDGSKSMRVSPYPLTSGKLCQFGASAVDGTPVSLILDEKEFAQTEATVVNFSLDAQKPNNWSLWKGSKAAPLLVLLRDDEKSVTSAEQLFGTSTRGEVLKVGAGTNFAHGYEALALLDKNQDGVISGSETLPLGLWFDADQDAKATPSEIKFVGDVGIHTIHYRDPRRNKAGDLEIRLGFERLVNGKNVVGRSIDWFAPTAETPELLLTAVQARGDGMQIIPAVDRSSAKASLSPLKVSSISAGNETALPDGNVGKVKKKGENPLPTVSSAKSVGNISGIWKFTLDGKGSPTGFFIIAPAGEKGRLQGMSFVVSQDPSDPKSPNRLLQGFEIRGSLNEDGTKGTWILPGNNKTLVKTEFEIRDGKMTGVSRASFGSDGKEDRVRYSFSAQRIKK